MSGLGPFLADALVVLGVTVMSVGIYGVLRMPDIYTRLHAVGKAVVLGVISFSLASIVTGDSGIVFRVLLIAALLLLTTPVAAHAIARAAYRRGELDAPSDARRTVEHSPPST